MLQVRSIMIPLVALLLVALMLSAMTASAASAVQISPDFGPNVILFDPSM